MFKQVRLHDAILKFYQRSQPIAFSNAETLYDDLVLLRDQILMYGDLSEAQTNYLNEFIEKFDTTLSVSVRDIFVKWLSDGFLTDLIRDVINEEVIEARGGKPTLKDRLDETTAQLAQKANQEGLPVNILDLGAKGDGETDNTHIFQNLINGKNVIIPEGVFLTNAFKINGGTTIQGSGLQKTVIKLNDGENSDLLVCELGGESTTNVVTLRDFTLDGNKKNNTDGDSKFTSVLKWYTKPFAIVNVNDEYPNKSLINNIETVHGAGNLVYLAGKNKYEYESGKFSDWNWIFHINDLWGVDCNRYGLWDQTTDNLFNNINMSYCGHANFYGQSANNRYNNMKLDGQFDNFPEVYDANKTDASQLIIDAGAQLVLNGCDNNRFTNLDIQSGAYAGIKIHNSKDCHLDGSCTNNGLYAGKNTGGSWGSGIGLRMTHSNHITHNLVFSSNKVPAGLNPNTPFYQGLDVQIPVWKNEQGQDLYSYYCTVFSEGLKKPTIEIAVGSQATCYVKEINSLASLDVLLERGDIITRGTYQPQRLPIGQQSQILQADNGLLKYVSPSKLFGDNLISGAPASSLDTGKKGNVRYDVDHIYICVGDNQWAKIVRVPF